MQLLLGLMHGPHLLLKDGFALNLVLSLDGLNHALNDILING